MQVAFDIVARPLRRAGQQRPGVNQHQRIVVDVDDPGSGRDPLGHLVGVVRGRQTGADVEELADARLAGQVPDGPAEEGTVGSRLRTMLGTSRPPCRPPRGRRRSCPCRPASSSRSWPSVTRSCRTRDPAGPGLQRRRLASGHQLQLPASAACPGQGPRRTMTCLKTTSRPFMTSCQGGRKAAVDPTAPGRNWHLLQIISAPRSPIREPIRGRRTHYEDRRGHRPGHRRRPRARPGIRQGTRQPGRGQGLRRRA